jgi:hypothetical protein
MISAVCQVVMVSAVCQVVNFLASTGEDQHLLAVLCHLMLTGGALVLMAMDNKAIQAMGYSYMLWPSLLLCLAFMLPVSAATNWLRRNRQFDWPGTSGPASSWHEKQRSLVRLPQTIDSSTSLAVMQPMQSLLQDLIHKIMLQGRHFLAWQLRLQPEQQRQQRQPKGGKLLRSRHQLSMKARQLDLVKDDDTIAVQNGSGWGFALDHATIDAAGAETAAAAESLGAAVRRRLQREADRQAEDLHHREQIWGTEVLPGLSKYEKKLDELQKWRAEQLQPPERPGQQSQGLRRLPTSNIRHKKRPNLSGPSWIYRWRAEQNNGNSQASGDSKAWQ